jgi:ketosteroid isomerase-like protein
MSAENVGLVRAFFAWLPSLGDVNPSNDLATLDRAFRDYLAEEFETQLPGDYPEGEPVFKGREGLARYAAMLRDTWSEWRFEPERFIEAGDRVVVFQRVVATGRASGAPIELTSTQVVTVRDGRMTSSCVYRDRAEALKAAGLEG